MERYQHRKHERIPENVAVVAGRAEPHRRNAQFQAVRRASQQVEEHRMNHDLQARIAIDLNIRLPQLAPSVGMALKQRTESWDRPRSASAAAFSRRFPELVDG